LWYEVKTCLIEAEINTGIYFSISYAISKNVGGERMTNYDFLSETHKLHASIFLTNHSPRYLSSWIISILLL